ncbi:MAG: glycosyltransferase [Promethearchaeota archaeon]
MNFAKIGELSRKLLSYNPKQRTEFQKKIQPPLRILRVICQRPYFTGSGVHLINLINQSKDAHLDQFIVFGQPSDYPYPLKEVIKQENTLNVNFKGENETKNDDLGFSVAGMSDQMPYKSTKFSNFNEEMLESYLGAFAEKINRAYEQFQPNIIHSHHLWLATALCRVMFPDIPHIATCHNTALRQMVLAPQLKEFVFKPIQDLDSIVVQNKDQKKNIIRLYKFPEGKLSKRIHIIGQGINTKIFFPSKTKKKKEHISLIYVGKLSYAKGVPQLITALKELHAEGIQEWKLYLAGSGEGIEKQEIIQMNTDFEDKIIFLGQIDQNQLASYLKESNKKKTKNMIAKVGKAKTLGERSLGPGAISIYLILKFMFDYVNNL